ncbi:uncharacterized protein B0H18DRAFT_830394, partial [Fomitopsis serialis]|uniref:uncharacterized protein n=1 Tax=Fomitopsis serialis TaxID=139415 RepID=UPI00200784B1
CPACDKVLKTPQGLAAHLSSARSCKWYNKGKNRELEDEEDGTWDDFRDVLENRDLFRFDLPVPVDNSSIGNQNEASSSSSAPRPAPPPLRVPTVPALDDDEDTRVEEEDPLAGRVIRMEPTIVETWRAYFAEEDEDEPMDVDNADGPEADERMDVDDEDRPPNECDGNAVWRPFASELDWRVAKWIISEDVGQKSLNRFLSIPGVIEKLGLTFKDVRELFMKVDGIPDRASWNTSSLTFPDRPDEAHLVRYRDILEAIKALLGNPSYAKHIVYRPRRVFADRSRTKRIFTEMWTGLWWNAVQVR